VYVFLFLKKGYKIKKTEKYRHAQRNAVTKECIHIIIFHFHGAASLEFDFFKMGEKLDTLLLSQIMPQFLPSKSLPIQYLLTIILPLGGTESKPVVYNLFCLLAPRYNFSSTLYPRICRCIIEVIHIL
jgi:sensor histidine kinase YesM